MLIILQHDDDCPLGVNGLRAYAEACEALASTPQEARTLPEDKIALAAAWVDLEKHHRCTCGPATGRVFVQNGFGL
jgi:hypothetical protein